MKSQYRNMQSMGTRLDMVFPGMSSRECDLLVKMCREELMRLDYRLSIHRQDSELTLINKTAHAGLIELDEEFSAIFREIEAYHRETGGFFDVALKPVQDFHGNPENRGLPPPENLRELAGMKNVQMDPHGILFRKKGVQLDLGGYGKGYAMRRIRQIMDSRGTGSALISFGESLIYGRGTHPHGDSWKVAVHTEGMEASRQFSLKDEVLSTSGNSLNNQKKFRNSGHIVDPVTMQMRRSSGMVCVKSDDPVRAEIYSTALYSAGLDGSGPIRERADDLEVRWIIPGPQEQ